MPNLYEQARVEKCTGGYIIEYARPCKEGEEPDGGGLSSLLCARDVGYKIEKEIAPTFGIAVAILERIFQDHTGWNSGQA